jgi:xylulokinase
VDFVRAVVEGVTFGLEYALRALRRTGVEARQVTLVGGGSASDGWAQVCADVFGVPVVRPPQAEAAALGAARQARWVVDGHAPAPDPTAADQTGQRFEPNPSPALRAAQARAEHLRDLALGGGL